MRTLPLRKSIDPKSIRSYLLIGIAVACFRLSPTQNVFGVTPAPDGGYSGNNTAEGQNALQSLTSGLNNAAIGSRALYSDTSGGSNTATGALALFSNTMGNQNTASGYATLNSNTSGSANTAIGFAALHGNTTASHNTATGYISLYHNTTGSFNVADGDRALSANTTGSFNTAIGYQALSLNVTGDGNTAVGYQALYNNVNTTAFGNTAVGYQALFHNTTSDDSSNALGYRALYSQTTGSHNNGFGWFALANNVTGSNNAAIGDAAGRNITGSSNTFLGANTGPSGTGSGNVYIGFGQTGIEGENNTTYIRNIYGTVQPVVGMDPDDVTISSSGRLGRANVSSRRYKHDIKPMDKASEAIFALKPVTFRYKQEFDPTQTLAFGLIAEEVEKVNPDLVGRNAQGQPESVRYDQIDIMLLNEFLKQHRKVQELEATIAQQTNEMEAIAVRLKEQASQIRKVNAQLELRRSTLQTVANR